MIWVLTYVLMEGRHALCWLSVFDRESLEEACMVHGLNADEVMANIQGVPERKERV